jgi:23S rRNA (uracil1939-C5)-methyltransferase
MRSRNGAPPDKFEIRIEKLVYGGWGLGRHNGKVVFVPFSVPGDSLTVREVENKKSFLRAAIVDVIEPGPGRVPPVCLHFGACGGCQWQNLEYPRQVEIKRQLLEQKFRHRFPETKRLPIEMKASPQAYGYRSRARIQIRGLGPTAQAGFFRFQSHLVEDVRSCPLFRPALNEALASIRLSLAREALNPGSRQLALACSTESNAWGLADMASDFGDGWRCGGTRRDHYREESW